MNGDAKRQPRSRRNTILGALLLTVGIVCLAFLLFGLARDLSIWVFGRDVHATVVDAWAERTSDVDAAEWTFAYYVTYQFTASNGKTYTNTTSVAPIEFSGLGSVGRGSGGVDEYDDISIDPAAPVYQEQRHIPEETIGGLGNQTQILVVYFPLIPQHNRLDDSRFVPLLACAYLPALALGWVATRGGLQLLRTGTVGWGPLPQAQNGQNSAAAA